MNHYHKPPGAVEARNFAVLKRLGSWKEAKLTAEVFYFTTSQCFFLLSDQRSVKGVELGKGVEVALQNL